MVRLPRRSNPALLSTQTPCTLWRLCLVSSWHCVGMRCSGHRLVRPCLHVPILWVIHLCHGDTPVHHKRRYLTLHSLSSAAHEFGLAYLILPALLIGLSARIYILAPTTTSHPLPACPKINATSSCERRFIGLLSLRSQACKVSPLPILPI